MLSVAVYDSCRAYGGGEEGGWYFDAGTLETTPELVAMGKFVETTDEAKKARDEIQAILDAEWNTGSRKYDISSVISGGKYLALIHEGWPPAHYPAERPRYE